MPTLSFIIPAYNEESRIKKSLVTALDYFSRQSYSTEIVVVDDGSKDRTVEIVRQFSKITLLVQPKNMGKGAAVRRGMLESTGKYRIFSDADFSTPVNQTEKLLSLLESGADVCVGSRVLDRSLLKVHQPWYREAMGRIFSTLVQILIVKGIEDTQCGFKGFTAVAAEEIFSELKIERFGFDVEIFYLAYKMGLRMEQIGIEWYNDERSTVNPLVDSTRMLFDLLRVKRLHRM